MAGVVLKLLDTLLQNGLLTMPAGLLLAALWWYWNNGSARSELNYGVVH
jgi:hypothetical protein